MWVSKMSTLIRKMLALLNIRSRLQNKSKKFKQSNRDKLALLKQSHWANQAIQRTSTHGQGSK